MACMKCGRDTQEGQVFCDSCLEIMQWYPVKPGTAVQLPKRNETPIRKAAKRRTPSAEEQNRHLRRVIRVLSILLILALILIGLMAGPTFERLIKNRLPVGQNYSTVIHPQNQPRETTNGN